MIIGLNGKAGAGKDTVANILESEYGYARLAFADKLKQFAYTLNPIIDADLTVQQAVDRWGWDYVKRVYPEARALLQNVGVEARNLVDTNVWVNLVKKQIIAKPGDYTISDFRFPNEGEMIRSLGGVVIKIIRPNNPDAIPSTHVSEQYEVDTPYVIINDGSLENLRSKVYDIRTEILADRKRARKYVFNGELQCIGCKNWQPLSNFPPDSKVKIGVGGRCRECVNDKSKVKPSRSSEIRHQQYIRLDKVELLSQSRKIRLKKNYGIDEEDYAALFLAQNGLCAICQKPESRTHHITGKAFMLAVDHDHESGQVRGLLCTKCNKAIGALGDTHDNLARVLSYLNGWSE